MRGPLHTPVNRPRERCETQACVERRRQLDEATLWALAIIVLGAGVLALIFRAQDRRRARLAAQKRQATHDRAQNDLDQLFAEKEDDNEKG